MSRTDQSKLDNFSKFYFDNMCATKSWVHRRYSWSEWNFYEYNKWAADVKFNRKPRDKFSIRDTRNFSENFLYYLKYILLTFLEIIKAHISDIWWITIMVFI